MKRHILNWSYWLGIASAVIALVLRGLNSVGMLLPTVVMQGRTIWYMSFYKAAFLFLMIAIATGNNICSHGQKE